MAAWENTASLHLRIINMVAFFIFGFVEEGLFCAVGISTAEDILAGTTISTSVVLLCITGPYFVGTLLMPPFVHRFPRSAVLSLQFCCFLSGLLLIAVVHNLAWNLVGVCLVSFGTCLGDVYFLAWTSCYEKDVVKAFTAGTGAGSWLVSVYYAAMTTWLCVTPNTTILTLLCLPPLIPLCYCFMEKKDTGASDTKTTNFKEVSYTPLNSSSSADELEDLKWREKCQVVRENALLLTSLFLGYFCAYLCIQSIVTILAFPDAPFDTRDHYQYYIFIFWLGQFIGRSYNLFASACLHTTLPPYTRHTWIFTLFSLASMLLLLFDVWFRFLYRVWLVLGLVFCVGINAGALYCSSYAAASHSSMSWRHVEFSRAFMTVGVGAGMVVASFIGLITEPRLKQHCLITSENGIYCITRAMNWTEHKCLQHA